MKGSKTEIYLVRHGETDMNIKGVYYGWTDVGLSEKGIMQAEDLADILHDVQFDAVISSSLVRAVETASIVSGYSPDMIIKDDRLRELNFGDWEGKHYRELKVRYKEALEKWGSDWRESAPPGGESFFEIYIRVKSSIKDILKEYKGKKVLIVSHQGTMRIIPLVLLGLTEDVYWSFTAEQGRYSLYEINEEGRCIIRRINSGR